ncbi:MAG: Gfo/Idh/MocA family oxidoreductase [Pirellulaceae bacterium]|nr:Gfo/Idh/MocA family oxidoreductase [Planctomycetaceae bacterium]
MPVGFGVVGCGMIAGFHARAIADIRGAKLVAGFDNFTSAADRYGKEFGVDTYGDLDEMLARDDLDVVTICTPSGAHMEPAVAAARAGKHVIVEKPLEITLKRCDAIIEACDANRVQLATIFPSRFHESTRLMKKAIEKGRFGRLTVGDAYVKWYRSQAYYDSGAWRGTWKLDGGGALMNQAIHSVDLLTWLMGPVAEINAQIAMLAHKNIEVEDVAMATVRFENGALGVIEATTAAYPGALKRIEVHGSAGSAVLEEEDIRTWDFAKSTKADESLRARMAGKTETGGGASDPSAIGHHGHMLLFKDFLAAIKGKRKPMIDGREGRRSTEIILAIYKAAETGRMVTLPLAKDPTLKARKTRVGGMG